MSETEDMSETENTPRSAAPTPSTADDLVEKIHEIQEEIFDREDQIDELLDASEYEERLLDAVEEGRVYRHNLHLKRLREDWDRMVARSREANKENDFELAAALVHFIGDILASQEEDIGPQWIEKLQEYLRDHRSPVN